MLRTEEARIKMLRELPKGFWDRHYIADDETEVVDIYTQFTPKDRRDLERKDADCFADEIKHQVVDMLAQMLKTVSDALCLEHPFGRW